MSEAHSKTDHRSPDLTYAELVHILVNARRRIALAACLGAVLAGVLTIATPRKFTAQAQLTPVGGGQQAAGRLSALAAQFGVGGMLAGGGESPDFLVDIVTSREMLMSLVDGTYKATVPSRLPFGLGTQEHRSGTLVELLELDNDPTMLAASREKALRKLRKDIVAKSRLESGIVSVSVSANAPDLAEALLRDLLAQLESFNINRRQSQAGAERQFVEERLGSAKQEVAAAERNLATFLERNRSFEGSPALRFEYETLMREVSLRHDILRTLAQANEHARIEEVRSTPVYTVVSAPYRPALPDRRNGVLKVIVGLVFGSVLGVAVALFAALLGKEREENPELAQSWPTVRGLLVSDIEAALNVLRRRRSA